VKIGRRGIDRRIVAEEEIRDDLGHAHRVLTHTDSAAQNR
jgi:hypothetical protein